MQLYTCGNCGQDHGWSCPYSGYPGQKFTEAERKERKQKMDFDRKHGIWPFKKKEEANVR